MLELTIHFDNKSPLYFQLYKKIKRDILSGNIPAGVKLPSKRKMASALSVSMNTIEAGYQQLEAEGYIQSVPRKGWFALQAENDLAVQGAPLSEQQSPVTFKKSSLIFDQTIDAAHFPLQEWKKNYWQALNRQELFHIGPPKGEPELTREIANHLYHSRGVRCKPEQIIISSGTQVLIERLIELFGERTYAIEDPGYYRVRQIFSKKKVSFVSVDESGLKVNDLEKTEASAVYITPSHQFPMGMIMPVSRRMELLRWANERESRYIIEDDYDGEYRYMGRPIPSLQGMDQNGKVIYLGTFSKSLLPSMRISYLILPEKLVHRFEEQLLSFKQTVSRIDQAALASFIKSGAWERHLNRMRTVYRKKRTVLLSALEKYMPDARVIGEKSGLHILIEISNGLTEEELINRAEKKGVKVFPVSIYYESKKAAAPMVLLGFGRLTEEEIRMGISLLSKAWFANK
ncbi:PLP-dependent aminotransferase family protein [Metabacillus sp. RGM 3146]|uniref:MocR-like pyridoxine biosynthesis transcription factor PdxR n=1 Tax=Metabacillus sp. RGM 3146 TaxID=3401092 RepID=UPI003B9BAE69